MGWEINIKQYNKSDKIILYSILGIITVGLAMLFLYNIVFGPSIKQATTKRYLLENVNGVVDMVYNDKSNHDIKIIILKNHTSFQIDHLWEPQIDIGDSLYKKKGSLFLEVYKKQGKKIVLDYRSLTP